MWVSRSEQKGSEETQSLRVVLKERRAIRKKRPIKEDRHRAPHSRRNTHTRKYTQWETYLLTASPKRSCLETQNLRQTRIQTRIRLNSITRPLALCIN